MAQITDETKAELRSLAEELFPEKYSHTKADIEQVRADSYRGICSCGEFATKLKGSERKAEASLNDHIKSKEKK